MSLLKTLTVFIFLLSFFQAPAQTGTIRGTIVDDQTGEPLIGATVLIAGTTNGAATDLDGKYTIANVQPGTYDLQSSYVSYAPQTIKAVAVTPGQVTIADLRLKPETVGLQEIVVEGRALRNTENALLTVQKRSAVVLDGISSEQFARTGDSDAGSAIKRVTGVTVEGGRYVYVRGLGDRYSKTTLNNAEIPGLDPNRNSVQMDLIPSNLIDNIVVYKTFSPELPGSFTGGYVNVTTKDFPDRFTAQVSGTLGYNTQSTFNSDFLTQNKSNLHWLGFDKSVREIPAPARGQVPNLNYTEQTARRLTDISRSFNKFMEPAESAPFLNHSFSASIGNQKELFGKPLGFIAGASYQRNYEFYNDGTTGRFLNTGTIENPDLSTRLLFRDAAGVENILWGAMLNTSLKLTDRSKVTLSLLRNQNSETLTRYQQGIYPLQSGFNSDTAQIQNRTMLYNERSLSSGQLKGEHAFGSNENPFRFDWLTSFTYSTQDEPDQRFFANDFQLLPDGRIQYNLAPANLYTEPARYFREMDEINFDNKANLTIPLNILNKAKFKTGGAFVYKDRSFNERIFLYRRSTTQYNGSVQEYISDENLGAVGETFSSPQYGVVIQDVSIAANSYDGTENVIAGYGMLEIPVTPKFKATAGVRFERTDIELISEDRSKGRGNIERNDFLPAINLSYELIKDMNVRAAYGRTLARPSFRELAPYGTFDFLGDFLFVGNPQLDRTVIDNYDVRWEYYPRQGEYLSVSGFYKMFDGPIERVINPLATENIEINLQNNNRALVYGMELEVRKNLDFIAGALKWFRVGANLTLVHSEVDIFDQELARLRVTNPGIESRRPMFGQSPYVVNALLGYNNQDAGTVINLSYNISGQRLAIVSSVGSLPNVYEQPRGILDLVTTQQFGGGRFTARVAAQNLLNPQYKLTHDYEGKEYIYQSSTIGRTFSVGLTYAIR